MGFGAAVTSALSKYASGSGRARRSEYWWFVLFVWLINLGVGLLSALTSDSSDPGLPVGVVAQFVVMIGLLLPLLALTVRRLHDAGFSGWWVLVGFVPFIGAIVLMIFAVLDGTHGPNEFGPDPKGRPARDLGPLTHC